MDRTTQRLARVLRKRLKQLRHHCGDLRLDESTPHELADSVLEAVRYEPPCGMFLIELGMDWCLQHADAIQQADRWLPELDTVVLLLEKPFDDDRERQSRLEAHAEYSAWPWRDRLLVYRWIVAMSLWNVNDKSLAHDNLNTLTAYWKTACGRAGSG